MILNQLIQIAYNFTNRVGGRSNRTKRDKVENTAWGKNDKYLKMLKWNRNMGVELVDEKIGLLVGRKQNGSINRPFAAITLFCLFYIMSLHDQTLH